MDVGRSTKNTDVMGEEFGELKQEYAEKIRKKGNDNLAQVIEDSTPSQVTQDGYFDSSKQLFPEFKDLLDEFAESVEVLQERGDEPYDHTQYFKETNNGTKFVANWLAQDIEDSYTFRHLEDSQQLFVFKDGYFQDRGREIIREECNKRLGDEVSRRRITEVTGIIEDRSFTRRHQFRPPQRKINFENGVYDLDEEQLVEHSPHYNFSYQIPVEYSEKPPDCEHINEFLHSIVETEEDVKMLKEIAGYLMLPDYPVNKAFILVGQGSNGKSRYIDLLKSVLGEQNYTNKSLHELEENRFATSKLYGKLSCFDDDLPSKKLGRSQKLKKLTGGSDVGAEIKYGGSFDFQNYAKLLFATNEMPQTDDYSDGFFRRWIILNFPYKFKTNPDPDNDQHKQAVSKRELMEKVTDDEQIQGFVWEIIEDLKDVLANDEFTYALEPDEVRQKWREHSVPMVRFIEKYVKQGTTYTEAEPAGDIEESLDAYNYDYIRKDTLHRLIGWYCEQRSHSAPSKKAIKRELDLTDLLFGVKRTRQEPEDKQIPVYSGLRLELDDEIIENLQQGAGGVQVCRVISQLSHGRTCACKECTNQSVQPCTPSFDKVRSVLEDLQDRPDDSVEEQTLMDELDCPETAAEKVIEEMKDTGELFAPKQGHVQLF